MLEPYTTMVDVFSRFVVAKRLPSKKDLTISNAILKMWILPYGPPGKICSDGEKAIGGPHLREPCARFMTPLAVMSVARQYQNAQADWP